MKQQTDNKDMIQLLNVIRAGLLAALIIAIVTSIQTANTVSKQLNKETNQILADGYKNLSAEQSIPMAFDSYEKQKRDSVRTAVFDELSKRSQLVVFTYTMYDSFWHIVYSISFWVWAATMIYVVIDVFKRPIYMQEQLNRMEARLALMTHDLSVLRSEKKSFQDDNLAEGLQLLEETDES